MAYENLIDRLYLHFMTDLKRLVCEVKFENKLLNFFTNPLRVSLSSCSLLSQAGVKISISSFVTITYVAPSFNLGRALLP